MANILDYQQKELDALGDNKIEASLNLHRKKLTKVTDTALTLIEASLPDATLRDTITAYDVARKHLNIIEGRVDPSAINIFIPPPELAAQYSLADEIKAQIIECQPTKQTNESPSTPRKQKLPSPATASES